MSTILETLKKLEEDKRLLEKDLNLKELVLQEDHKPSPRKLLKNSSKKFMSAGADKGIAEDLADGLSIFADDILDTTKASDELIKNLTNSNTATPATRRAANWLQNNKKALSTEGTRNIVVFNPDDITQVKRDGELVFENKLGLKDNAVPGVAEDLTGLLGQ